MKIPRGALAAPVLVCSRSSGTRWVAAVSRTLTYGVLDCRSRCGENGGGGGKGAVVVVTHLRHHGAVGGR
jgi:hypothetical protein